MFGGRGDDRGDVPVVCELVHEGVREGIDRCRMASSGVRNKPRGRCCSAFPVQEDPRRRWTSGAYSVLRSGSLRKYRGSPSSKYESPKARDFSVVDTFHETSPGSSDSGSISRPVISKRRVQRKHVDCLDLEIHQGLVGPLAQGFDVPVIGQPPVVGDLGPDETLRL